MGMIDRARLEVRLRRHTWPARLGRALAWRVPAALAYWCAIRVAAETTAPGEHPDEHTVPQMLSRWEALPGSLCGWCGRTHVGRCSAYREAVEEQLTPEERQSLTVHGDAFAAQYRGGSLALHIRDDAPHSSEDGHPVILPRADVERLYALLDACRSPGIDTEGIR